MTMTNFNLLSKHFAKETSEDEELQVITWRNESAENLKRYRQLQDLWETSGDEEFVVFDTTMAFRKVSNKIKNKGQAINIKPSPVIKPLWRWAVAACIALMSIAWGMYRFPTQTEIITKIASKPTKLLLADGTVVQLNKGAVLTYPSAFDGETRNVSLKGEAFFDVAHNPTKPFIIDAGQSDIQVVGTSFNVRATEKMAEVVVKTGKVKFKSKKEHRELILTAGEKGVYQAGKLAEGFVDKNDLAWQTEMLVFEEKSFVDVINTLSRYYQVDIKLVLDDTAGIEEYKINESYRHETLDNVLKDLQKLLPISYQKNTDGSITITGHLTKP
jgi:transmembrane sensor